MRVSESGLSGWTISQSVGLWSARAEEGVRVRERARKDKALPRSGPVILHCARLQWCVCVIVSTNKSEYRNKSVTH